MKLVLLGDIALIGNASRDGKNNYIEYYREVANYLATADYVVGNLESPFSIEKRRVAAKSVYLCSEPHNVDILKMLNLSAVTLANNHMFDYGKEGYEVTKKLLETNKIDWFGTEGKELVVDIEGNKLAFSGFCCYSSNPPGCVRYGKYGVNEFNMFQVPAVLEKYKNKGRLNIMAVHAGIEHTNYPDRLLVDAAHNIADKYDVIYYGHHPHVSQGLEKYKKSLIAYSLGNFCFDDTYLPGCKKPFVELTEDNRKSFILEIVIEDNKIVSYRTIPIYIGRDRLYMGKGTTNEELSAYTECINKMTRDEYQAMRKGQRQKWINERIKKRNLWWYLSRLRLRYIRLFMSNRRNAKLYQQSFLDYFK